ncbi:MAG: Acg family FMN-binding oxidoreductase [Chloroflexota bacterium]
MKRRAFLKVAGLSLLAVAGGVVYRAGDQGVFHTGQGQAYKPWQDWDSRDGGGVLSLVRAAVLAASPHNTQPWLFRLAASTVDLHADPGRNLGTVDRFRREMYLGLGCALENLALAASARGWQPDIQCVPDPGDRTWAARIALTPGKASPSLLYPAIPHRCTNRAAYAASDLPAGVYDAMQRLIGADERVRLVWLRGKQASRFGELTYAATEAFGADAAQSADSGRWFRHDWDDIQARCDGLTLDAQASPPLLTTLGKLLPPLSDEQNHQYWLRATRAQMTHSAAFGILAVPDASDHTSHLQAGRVYQRFHLWAVTQGLAMHPVNQIVERAEREASQEQSSMFGDGLAELVADASWQGVLLFRIGYPTVEALPSPRRAAERVILP